MGFVGAPGDLQVGVIVGIGSGGDHPGAPRRACVQRLGDGARDSAAAVGKGGAPQARLLRDGQCGTEMDDGARGEERIVHDGAQHAGVVISSVTSAACARDRS